MPAPLYFFGKPSDLGNVAALKQQTFAALVNEVIRAPVRLALTRDALHSLPEKEQNQAKRVKYLTACTFTTNPSVRTKGHAGPCNLIFLDVDRADDALRLLASQWPIMLRGFAHCVYHTARSTPTKPRLRVVVSADAIPLEQYPQAVGRIAERVGVEITRESLVVVQPMFLPTSFQHDNLDPIVTADVESGHFTVHDLQDYGPETPEPAAPPSEPAQTTSVVDLSHLRTPIEGVTAEDVVGALEHLDPDCSMMQWIEFAGAIKHQFGEAGYVLWRDWSFKGKKFTSEQDTRYRWDSLRGQTKDRVPVTIRTLFRQARLRGWANDRLAKQAFNETLEWLRDSAHSTEILLDQAAPRIARVTPLVGETHKSTLITVLKERLKIRGMPTSITAIRADIEKLEAETERKAAGIPAWAAGLVFVTAGGYFYRYNVDRRFAPEVIDLMYTPPILSDKTPPRTSSYLVKQVQVPQVENLRYEPSNKERIFTAGGVPYVNIYRETYAKSEPARMEEAGKIVEEHTRNMIGEPEFGATFLDWLCYHVQHPGKKIRWAPLIQSTKGAGKGWFAEVMQVVLGLSNVSILMPSGIMQNQYNDWAYGHQLLVLNEIRVVGMNRHDVMDKLKPGISDDVISINQKYENHRTVPNVTNYLLFTNYHDALAIQDDERRYFVISSPLQRAEHIAALGGEKYFDRLYDQVKNNPGGLRAYFEHRKIGANFKPDGRAPVTRYMIDLVHAAASPLAAAMLEAIEDQLHPLVRKDLVSLQAIRTVLDSNHVGRFTDQALGTILREMGWKKSLRCRLAGERHQLWTREFVGEDVRGAAQERMEIL